MSKKKSHNNKEKNVTVSEIISEDKNKISDASNQAIQNVDSVVYADNLVKRTGSSKTIRELNIQEKNDETEKNEENIENEITEKEETPLENKTEDVNVNTDNSNSDNVTLENIEIDKNNTNTNNSQKSYKTILVVSICAFVIFMLLFTFSTIFALINRNNTNIINGITINNIDISGLSKEDAINKLTPIFNKKLEQSMTLKHNDSEVILSPKQLDMNFNIAEAVELAYSKGRTGNIFEKNYDILVSLLSGIKVNSGLSYNEDSFTSLINEMQSNFPDKLVEPSYYVDNTNLIISKGKDGIVIDSNKLTSNLICIVNDLNSTETLLNIPTEFKKASTLNINTVYNEIRRDPQDAYYTTEPYKIYPHVDGIDFDISIEEAINLFNNSTDTCSIPLKFEQPSITVRDLGIEAFPDLLASYSTKYSTSNKNRSTNIRLASEKVDGIVIMPGEIFSYNTTVGQRTAAAGFKSAAVYVGGEVTNGIGGGICQVSSTLYNAALLSNLEIVERYNHGFNPGYVPAGRDATVSWGGPDFKFQNTRNYPIKVVCSGTGGTINVEVYGFKEENEYEVEIESYITRYIPYSTIEKNNPNLAKGETIILQNGSSGCKSVAYRILKKDGEIVSKTLLSQDTYNPHNKIVSVGTAE